MHKEFTLFFIPAPLLQFSKVFRSHGMEKWRTR